MTSPLVSVIIPTYNYGYYILEAIESLKKQSYDWKKIEVIIVDDGSTDNTEDLVKSYVLAGEIFYIYQSNHGKAHATKRAIEQCTGKYIFNLDADDYFLPDNIRKFVDIFESDSQIVHVASAAQLLESKSYNNKKEAIPATVTDKVVTGHSLLYYFYTNNILYGGGSTYAARADVLQAIDIPVTVDMYVDEFLILALLPFGSSYIFTEPCSIWRIHSSNYSNPKNMSKQETLVKKQRAIRSSDSILEYLKLNQSSFKPDIIKIYTLKNLTYRIVYKEIEETKTISDILNYLKHIILEVGINPKWLWKHYSINRLMPLSLFMFLKKVNHRNTLDKRYCYF